MADASHQQTINNYVPETSIDLLRKHTFHTTSLAGIKRPHWQGSVTAAHGNQSGDVQLVNVNDHPSLPAPRLQASSIITVPLPQEPSKAAQQSEYSQRRHLASTPGLSQNPLLSLRHSRYGLPEQLVSNLESMGVRSIYPWQSSCLLGKGLLSGETSLIYTAPTGGGKSLVADVVLLKRIIEDPSKKAILVLPYVALVQERMKWLRKLTEGVTKNLDTSNAHGTAANSKMIWKKPHNHVRVAGFFGGSTARTTWVDIDIAVCTIEKANALVNAAIEEGRIDELRVVVLDELHMIDEENRGYIMELMITKLLVLRQNIQLVGMSATLSNPKLLADWLGAKFYVSRYRPIPIEEYLVYENSIYVTANAKDFFRTASQLTSANATEPSPTPCRTICASLHRDLANPVLNAVVALALETAISGYGVLVFCSSRQGSQNLAVLIAEAMPTGTSSLDVLDRRMDLLAALQALPGGFEPALSQTLLQGVAFHHAGLTSEEREIVTDAYDQGALKVMVATCSLAAGINLPARRVIINGGRMGRELVGPAMLRQMRGRAGRKGKDEVGESYLCCQKTDLEAVAQLLEAELPGVQSCMSSEKRGIKRALLEIIVTRLANSRHTVEDYVRKSLLFQTADRTRVWSMVDAAIEDLCRTSLIQTTSFDSFEPTTLGQAIVASSLTPEDGIFVHNEMRRALESFVMDGEMHIFYLFTPVQTTTIGDISWPVFRDQMGALDESGLRALRCIGVSPSLVNSLVNSGTTLKENTPDEICRARTYRRAFAAFQLRDLCNEIPIHKISSRYSVPRGFVQTLAQTCHGFAAGMIKFCQRMGWGMLAAVLEHMVDRLRAGARADLLEMAQVTHVKSRMARILWENGFKSVRALAEAEAKDLVPVMMLAQSRKLRMQGEARDKLMLALKQKAEVIVGSANRLWGRQQLVEIEDEC
ncbi:hypothetical protein EPUS_00342 [Endocarpon pusillum Z07020]|uniref:DNA-directed DNA polymerase theta n=1 Tax=Endocarpon pusillum (strain Z07020 / HMAS-L-300199) TaxID=1263415 RepID=U1HIZ5_ENDPU|nr:uncharacterized protein EPUS_00342 [Endocarpon pusillum Z07020]ERF70155.1 hypothetical protein EPUS_00342 [Endocarpon pusillum Z07020]